MGAIIAKQIELTNGGFTLVDNHLFEKLNQYKWYDNGNGYVATSINGKKTLLHRFILNVTDKELVDHIDNDPKNNLSQNLRVVTQSQNMRNMKKKQTEIPNEFIRLSDACKLVNKSRHFFYYYFRNDKLTKYKILGTPLIKKSELDELLKVRNT